jgi:cytochrome c-type protein NapC
MHGTYLVNGERTCIDCHKGIAHLLPDMGVALRSP